MPLLILWALFFVMGLFPGEVFALLREMGLVVTQDALVNSPHTITVAFALYMGFFAYRRCEEAGLTVSDAQWRGLLVCVLGLLAFLDVPLYLLLDMPVRLARSDRLLYYLVGPTKLLAWVYLYINVLRYYALGDDRVFAMMFPRAGRSGAEGDSVPAPPPNLPAQGADAHRDGHAQESEGGQSG